MSSKIHKYHKFLTSSLLSLLSLPIFPTDNPHIPPRFQYLRLLNPDLIKAISFLINQHLLTSIFPLLFLNSNPTMSINSAAYWQFLFVVCFEVVHY